ncbi:uncharacterized protein LOC125500606 [Athalia rosae]|uniref:uncharacterized protein LOC125500606 n=1 Tax=Athalia rosae TaxID=37344 RepID=UPI0020347B9E|nr:uncharacterized protein LOC125500606 [Athalia rosae]
MASSVSFLGAVSYIENNFLCTPVIKPIPIQVYEGYTGMCIHKFYTYTYTGRRVQTSGVQRLQNLVSIFGFSSSHVKFGVDVSRSDDLRFPKKKLPRIFLQSGTNYRDTSGHPASGGKYCTEKPE